MEKLRARQALSSEARGRVREGPLPTTAELMQPVPMGRDDPGSGWFFEPLFGGIRCLALYDGASLRLLEHGIHPLRRAGLEERLIEAGPVSFALDGMILDVDPSFEQGLVLPDDERIPRDRVGKSEQRFLAFDLLHAVGDDLRAIPLLERRAALRALFRFSPSVMYVRESSAPAKLIFHQADHENWLGVVAKRAESPYLQGRSPEWRVWRRASG